MAKQQKIIVRKTPCGLHLYTAQAGAAFATMICGGAFAFGSGTVCRWMKWAPVNMTVNVHNYGEAHSIADDVGTGQQP